MNGQPGNAVVAIYDMEDADAEDATILWSYHIWVTDVADQPFGVNSKGNSYTVMDRNLGAVSATPGDAGAIGLLYQWGRKDPFVTTSEIGKNTEAEMYDQSGGVSLKIESGSKEVRWPILSGIRLRILSIHVPRAMFPPHLTIIHMTGSIGVIMLSGEIPKDMIIRQLLLFRNLYTILVLKVIWLHHVIHG